MNTFKILSQMILVVLFYSSLSHAETSKITFLNVQNIDGIKIFFQKNNLTQPSEIVPSNSKWVINIEHSEISWRTFPTFIVVFEGKNKEEWPFDFDDLSIAFNLNINKLQSINLEIPIHLFESRSVREMDRLDNLNRDDQLFEKIFISAQLAKHYISRIPEPESQTRRAVKLWFDTSFRLVQEKEYLIQLDQGILETALRVFENNERSQSTFIKDYNDLRAEFWSDIYKRLRPLLDSKKCATASHLLDYVLSQHQRYPELFYYRLRNQDPEDVLSEWSKSINFACDG